MNCIFCQTQLVERSIERSHIRTGSLPYRGSEFQKLLICPICRAPHQDNLVRIVYDRFIVGVATHKYGPVEFVHANFGRYLVSAFGNDDETRIYDNNLFCEDTGGYPYNSVIVVLEYIDVFAGTLSEVIKKIELYVLMS